jgi:cytoskeletal protein CcmA (bactofilin family)
VGADGHVRATIVAQDVVVIGHVEGEIRATGRVELRDGAVVLGDVFASRLSIEEGATLRGGVDPSRANEPFPASSVADSAPRGGRASGADSTSRGGNASGTDSTSRGGHA